MDNQIEPKPNSAVIYEPELVLDEDEQFNLAKFLDALLEADMTNKSNERRQSSESVLSHTSGSNFSFEPMG
ncbi:MAG: hypothetical protein WBB39_00120 [Candidatus Saccharimonadales bacterium]